MKCFFVTENDVNWMSIMREGQLGFSSRKGIETVQTGDKILCYCSSTRLIFSVGTITSSVFESTEPLYSKGTYRYRLSVNIDKNNLDSGYKLSDLIKNLGLSRDKFRGSFIELTQAEYNRYVNNIERFSIISKKQDKVIETYDEESIHILKGLDHVRKRPTIYIVDTDKAGLHQLPRELMDNFTDEHVAGFCGHATVEIYKDDTGAQWFSASDDGRGIPIGLHKIENKPTLEVIMLQTFSGGKISGNAYKTSSGLNGCGLAVTNALASKTIVEVKRENPDIGDGKIYLFRQEFSKGHKLNDLEIIRTVKENEGTGTRVAFTPDESIFTTVVFDREIILERIKELAYLNRGLVITLIDSRDADEYYKQEIHYDEGIAQYLEELNNGKLKLNDAEHIHMAIEGELDLDYTFQYVKDSQEMHKSYANNINTYEGGTHQSAFLQTFTKVILDFIRDHKLCKNEIVASDIRQGLTSIVAIKLNNPMYQSQAKSRLQNQEIIPQIKSLVSDSLSSYLRVTNFKSLWEYIDEVAEERIEIQKAKENAKSRKTLLRRDTFSKHLADVDGTKPVDDIELFLVEGDSAAGNLRKARDKSFQAILGMTGKLGNSEKMDESDLLNSKKIVPIFQELGGGIKEDYNSENLRYGKVIIATDSDADGIGHICPLLIALFWNFMPKFIEEGRLYIAEPPLYTIRVRDKGVEKRYFARDEQDKDKIINTLNLDIFKIRITRNKGLGEMNMDETYETLLDVSKRTLRKITVSDAKATSEMLTRIMGNDTAMRKKLLEEKYSLVSNNDEILH